MFESLTFNTELVQSDYLPTVQALISALPPACVDCIPIQNEQASMLAMWLEVGRIKNIAQGVSRILEVNGCLHTTEQTSR